MKFIHCADIHLDSPMTTHMSPDEASKRRSEIEGTFERMTTYAKEEGVRAVVIAGDLFDGSHIQHSTIDAVLTAVKRTPEVDYLYLAGNHDNVNILSSIKELPENLKMFDKKWSTYIYENVAISGVEICKENADSIYDDVPHKEGCVNIVVLHGQIGTTVCDDEHININLLKNKGIDYLALGHIHSYQCEKLDDVGEYCYSGCLEGRSFDECGEKGFVLITSVAEKIKHEFIPFCSRQLHKIEIDVTALTSNSEVIEKIEKESEEIQNKAMVEFVLTGESNPADSFDISTEYLLNKINDRKRFGFVKIKNETQMGINYEDYKNDISLKGEFIRLVLESEDINETEKNDVIRFGLQALFEGEIRR